MLTEIQLFVIGAAAAAIVWTLKLTKAQVSSGWLTTGVYVVSAGLALAFAPLSLPAFPPFTDAATFMQGLVTWLGAVMIPLSAFVGFATLVYNALLKAVLEKYVRPLIVRAGKR